MISSIKNKREPRSYDSWKLFSYFLQGIDALTCGDNYFSNDLSDNLDSLESNFEYTNLSPYQVKNLFRDGYKDGTLNFSDFDDPKVFYLSRCLGHKVSQSKFLRFPRLCVLYSLCILKDRWRYAEDEIVRDDVASYFYAKYVIGGRLPEKMHTQIVLNTFLCKSPAIQKYFSVL